MAIRYNEDGEFDLDSAAETVAGAGDRTDDPVVKRQLARIQTAALLDIASSLRTLALESAIAMRESGMLPVEPDVDADELPDVRPEDAPAGSRVRIMIGDRQYEGTLTGEGGIDQDEPWVMVVWDAPAGAAATKEWAAVLTVTELPEAAHDVAGSEGELTLADVRHANVPLVGVATEAETPALLTDGDEDGEEAAGGYELDEPANTVADVDDIDADFDGDRHPAAADALAALKAREKAAKSKKGKK